MFDAPFPKALLKLYELLSSLSLGFEVASPKCAGLSSHFYSLLIGMYVALGTVLLVLMATPLRMMLPEGRLGGHGLSFYEMASSPRGSTALRDVFVVALLLHPTVSGKSMEFFRCREIEGECNLQ